MEIKFQMGFSFFIYNQIHNLYIRIYKYSLTVFDNC